MKKLSFAVATAALVIASPVLAGISKNSRVPAGSALLIGGDTPRGVDIDGQNRSTVRVDLLVERDGERRLVRTLEARESFMQYIRADETIVLRNTSDDARATIYWHISGYSKQANPRVEPSRP
ncbi:MAG: hypothetical protein AAGL10_03875 [Pseudomonadota bacterium]